ncbi:MAG: UDP-2,4-diacetamido-2,4,6-trideoxy-beta-L-altropyranose hydrolase [Elusimicrobia bacterium]|nr:UDP-2,4-diacetamido-2,4,6-trideoxy-beta-L-altropyranose hydrolase [Elusimicrobiota bacterium]
MMRQIHPAAAPLLLLRADAGPGIGSGHAARLLALGKAWIQGGGRARLLTSKPSQALRARAGSAGVEIAALPASYPDPSDLAAVLREASSAGSDAWIALDGYGFDAGYLGALRKEGLRVLRVDDAPALPVPCDVLLDQNPGAEGSSPRLADEALPLLGPRWALLDPAFARAGERRDFPTRTPKLLVSFGGWDPDDATGLALRALRLVEGLFEAVVVIGSDNPRGEALSRLAVGLPVRFERSADMPALMAEADLALIGGGVTMLEACAAALPAIIATIAANQESGAAEFVGRGLVRGLGRARDLSEASLAQACGVMLGDAHERARLSAKCRAAVDGLGAARVAAALRALAAPRLSEGAARLRPAAPTDALEVWRIANDPAVRANSFHSRPIPLIDHLGWFDARLGRTDERYWIVEAGHVVAGQVRYARAGEVAEVHYSVRGAFRGKGLGTFALAESRRLACRELGVRRLTGVVIMPNEPSERSFVSAGWTRSGVENRAGRQCSVFESLCS